MMKTVLKTAVLAAAVLLAGGCDFFRGLAGRPTSADIEAKREVIARAEAAQKARLDSLAAVEKQCWNRNLIQLNQVCALFHMLRWICPAKIGIMAGKNYICFLRTA